MCHFPRASVMVFASFVMSFTMATAYAQVTTGAVTGRVTHDSTPLPGVSITIASPSMQGKRVTQSSVNGDYSLPSIPPGNYTVSFEMDGMTTVWKRVTVGLAKTERVDADLALESVAEALTVVAAAPTVLETTEVQSNYTSEDVDRLPIERSLSAIALLAPGVKFAWPGIGVNVPAALIISGAPFYDNLFLIDGSVSNDTMTGQSDNLFIEDAILETSVLTAGISAEYGRFSGGVVSMISKSGGNDLSGSFRDSFTNPEWTEPSRFGEPESASVLDETYEATLGGAILRDRLWFFLAGRLAETTTTAFYVATATPRPASDVTDERIETKATGQLTPGHSVVGAYLDYSVEQTNVCGSCLEPSAIDPWTSTPRLMLSVRYDALLTNNTFLEGGYSSRERRVVDAGGPHRTVHFDDPRDVALGTFGFDLQTDGGIWGAPSGCGACPDDRQENETLTLKVNRYFATREAGTHRIIGGYERFVESTRENMYGSGSDFLYVGSRGTHRDSAGNLYPIAGEGDTIVYTPIRIQSAGSELRTESIFVNDKWDIGSRWSLNLGLRYDRNDGMDSAGNQISKDSALSPRLGVIYDAKGDGRFRLNVSYSRYVSKLFEGWGSAAGGAGYPSFIYYAYRGPTIGGLESGLDSFALLEEVFRWFFAAGGISASDLLAGPPYLPGVNTRAADLVSPNVDEWTVGFGTQLGNAGLVRIDYIDREWHDAYGAFSTPGDEIESPLVAGDFLDVYTYENADNLVRTYRGVTLQGSYRFTPRLNLGGNYTWSESRGNYLGGEYPTVISSRMYPEYRGYRQFAPIGYLETDQPHKAKLWMSYERPLFSSARVNLAVLESYESGRPYSAYHHGIKIGSYVVNPGYRTPPESAQYFFSRRGEYRWESATSTDLAVNFDVPLRRTTLFLHADVLNVFNAQAQISGSTAIETKDPFNPFTETPRECPQGEIDCSGYHWQKTAIFGKAYSRDNYQLPRTYRFSAGVRF